MRVTRDFVEAGLALNGVPVPEDEIENVRLRLELWLAALEEVETAIGAEMNAVDPIPPVYPRPEW